jgi:hypothetical protein
LDNILAVKPDITSVEINGPHLLLQRRPREAIAAIEKFLQDQQWAKPGTLEYTADRI